MNDLMAIATVRRLFVELGYQLMPEGSEGLVGPLSLWIVQPRHELEGQSPLQVLAAPAGEQRVRQVLVAMLSEGPARP